ncbi:MAG: hypothetical protein ACPIOQ_13125, partial [Promethearchaeia archaeon]
RAGGGPAGAQGEDVRHNPARYLIIVRLFFFSSSFVYFELAGGRREERTCKAVRQSAMGIDYPIDVGFDIYPPIQATAEDQAKWADFLRAVRDRFRGDSNVVFDRAPGIAVQFGPRSTWNSWHWEGSCLVHWPILTDNGVHNTRFAIKLYSGYSWENLPDAHPYLQELANLARRSLGDDRVHEWTNDEAGEIDGSEQLRRSDGTELEHQDERAFRDLLCHSRSCMRCLFEWDKEYNVELRLALACALHPRLGANSPARVLDAELLQRITELQVWPPTPDVLDNVRRREGERYEQQRIDEEATVLFDCLMAQQDQAPYLRKDTEDTKAWGVRIFRNPTGRYYDKGILRCHLYLRDGDQPSLYFQPEGPFPLGTEIFAVNDHPRGYYDKGKREIYYGALSFRILQRNRQRQLTRNRLRRGQCRIYPCGHGRPAGGGGDQQLEGHKKCHQAMEGARGPSQQETGRSRTTPHHLAGAGRRNGALR